MKIKNRYTKVASTKEQPKKDHEGNVFGAVSQVGIEQETKFGHPALKVWVKLEGENGGTIEQVLFFDIMFTKSNKGLSKLPRVMQRLELLDDSELSELLVKEEFEITDLAPVLSRFKDLELKFKTVLKNDRFSVDYDSIKLKSAESSLFIL